jgi:hypothetical protein
VESRAPGVQPRGQGCKQVTAALYIDPRGPYPKIPGLDCWDATRDANKYDGPGPIVAHPPCGPWSTMRHLYKGAEHDCAPRAVAIVRKLGGVLEHPARSALWNLGLPLPYPRQGDAMPYPFRDAWGGYTIEVEQVNWGHVARKRTWLYIVGLEPKEIASEIRTGAQPTHWASGSRGKSSRKGSPVPPGIKVCSAQQRRRTPVAFAEWLVSIAARCTPVAHTAQRA